MSLKIHEKLLKDKVFFNNSKWPHFDLLFKDIKKISKILKKNQTVISLERTNLYGGSSLFAPYFEKKNFISIDCITEKLLKRGQYNKKLLTDKNIIKNKSQYQFNYKRIKLKNEIANCVMIPNLMHHIDDPDLILKKAYKLLKNNGYIYIFEPLVRELHQIPEDYGRFTPFSFKNKLEKIGFKNFKYELIGGPFTCMYYYFNQTLEYLPKEIKSKYIKSTNIKFEKILNLEKKFNKNLIRKNSQSPMAFSIFATK